MSTGTVQLERRGHVLLIGLDRVAKRNAFDLPLWDALARAYGELDRDPALRVGVLHALGDHFTGGLDLPSWAPVFAGGTFAIPDGGLDPLGLAGPRLRKPVVCAVQGICYTIGIELLLATDVRIAARSTRFGQIEIKRGIYPVGGATLRFPREVGWANAMRWLLTGDEFDAGEALRIGRARAPRCPRRRPRRRRGCCRSCSPCWRARICRKGCARSWSGGRACSRGDDSAAMTRDLRLIPDAEP
jgi:enoyl-CoA hydratase/carnithine racemase